MEDSISSIIREQQKIKEIIKHYNDQFSLFEKKLAASIDAIKRQQIENIMEHYRSQISYWRLKHYLLDEKIAKYRGGTTEVVALSQEALEWWPFLKELVQRVNKAAKTHNEYILKDIFIEAANNLGMKIEDHDAKQAEIITLDDLRKALQFVIWNYKNEIKNMVSKRKRIKDPSSKRGPLKKATLKQYQSIIKNWAEKKSEFKREIQDLKSRIRSMESATMLRFKNGMILTVHYGGKCSVI